ncbi:hypothetical protein QLG20_13475 [Klebsiella variicola]|uniref:hypothetical protein n=1 Tax=Klebsiella variicola TaxID=244366 RepID=UPI0024A69D6C|nr:hypothetical protein [Klebsiella variicola]WHE65260.1 hypothetical protein QLG20_13475 [Klebsiella variicola]HBW0857802.1 hypothetical protein [Klebsiella variicola]HBW0863567.1 hypothetical protein [Klebsiella variicola]HBW0868515.1 hypothetical protein [Klebsiella variicola]
MSENNYGALMMKSALSASVDINTILLPGIYIIPPDSPSSPDQNGGILTVHHGQPKLRTFNSVYVISATSKYEQNSLKWGEWLYDVTKNQLASSDGFKLIGQVRSAAALASLPGSDGDRVLLTSFHELSAAEMPVGGGEFYYASTMAGVNNGVTVFNGWCRKIINNSLTDHDAGCLKDDISDVSSRLAALFSVIEDGMTITFHCENQASRNFVIKNRKGIRITAMGRGGISCWRFRDNYTWVFDTDFEAGNDGLRGSLGILSFYNCPDSQVDNINITGVQLIHPLSNEWGDCGIRYENCQRFKTIDNTLSHFGGWGIFGGFGSHGSKSHGNHVNHTHRQSGINIWANSNNCHAWGNYCFDNGLYNFEIETFSNHGFARITGGSCKLNFGTLAKINVAIVGVMKDMDASGNTLSMGVGSIAAIGVKDSLSTRIKVNDNKLGPSWYGLTANNSRNVIFSKNIGAYSEPDFLITDQYQAPVKLDPTDPNVFYSTIPIAPEKIIKIVDSVYTVVGYSPISAQELFGQAKYYKLDTFYKITLKTPIQPDFHTFANILFAWSTLNTTNGTHAMITNNPAFSQGNVVDGAENVQFIANDMSGFKFGISPQNTYSVLGGEQEFYLGNILDCESWLRTGLALASRVSINGNIPSMGTSMSALVTGSNTTYWKPTRSIGKDGVAAAGTAPTRNYFRVDKTSFVIGYRVILRNWSSTEDVKLILANVNNPIAITAAGSGTEKVVEVKTHLYALSPDTTYPLYLTTASNALVAGWYSIEALILE